MTFSSIHCSLHWSDLHQALLEALPEGMVRFCHTVTSSEQREGSQRVTVRVERRESKDSEETEGSQLECDLLVAADGSMSATRRRMRPDESRRCVVGQAACVRVPAYAEPRLCCWACSFLSLARHMTLTDPACTAVATGTRRYPNTWSCLFHLLSA